MARRRGLRVTPFAARFWLWCPSAPRKGGSLNERVVRLGDGELGAEAVVTSVARMSARPSPPATAISMPASTSWQCSRARGRLAADLDFPTAPRCECPGGRRSIGPSVVVSEVKILGVLVVYLGRKQVDRALSVSTTAWTQLFGLARC